MYVRSARKFTLDKSLAKVFKSVSAAKEFIAANAGAGYGISADDLIELV